MDISDQSKPAKPTWRARIGAAWQVVKTKAATWWAMVDKKALKEAALIVLLVCALAVPLWFWLRPVAEVQPVSVVATSTGLQDQIDALRLRVIVLEARADALPKTAAAPRASVPRAGASTPTAPDPDQFADTSELVESPTPPAPITRQSVDQFRASLRTPQPVQE